MTIDTRDRRFLLGILVLALLLRTYHLRYPFWDYFASRQTFNLMVVRDYVRDGIRLLHPTVDWLVSSDTSRPSYFCAEFPWLHALGAIEIRLLPFGDWSTRLIPITFSLAGLWWMYGLAGRVFGRAVAHFAALAWAILPFSIFFGRAFMSDLPALSLATGALNALCVWLDTRRPLHFVLFVLAGLLAALIKPQVVIFSVAATFLVGVEFRRQVTKQPQLYLGAFMISLPTALWLHHAGELSRAGGPPVIGGHVIGRSLQLWLHAPAWSEQWHRMFDVVLGPVGLVLAAAGFLWKITDARQYLFHIWFAATAVMFFFMPEVIVGWNDYYLLLFMPPSAGLIGIALGNLIGHPPTRVIAILLGTALAISSFVCVRPLFKSDELHYDVGTILNHMTIVNDLIITAAGGSPDPLYFAQRRGWEASRYDLRRLEELTASGAKVFAIADPDAIQKNRDLLPLLDSRFVRLTEEDPSGSRLGWMAWSLDESLQARTSKLGKTTDANGMNFGGEIGLRQISVRELLRWPASFEITCDWECLKKMRSKLRVFVHVTTTDGHMVFQEDHWPLAAHLPTTQWRSGDVVRERYLMVLPEGFSPGRYQIRGGWFDPTNGGRRHVAGDHSDGEDRAILADVCVRDKPSDGWFSR